jgi:aspartyl-tRNA(Asn)/glutamyl-tRNA(Gln) amidotransferase subunit A
VPIYTVEAYALWGPTIEAEPDVMFHQIRARFRMGRDFAGTDYAHALARLAALKADWAAATAGLDAVLMPTTPNLPPRVDRLLAEDAYYARENMLTLRNSRIANMLGLAALTLPTGTPSVGLMAMATGGGDRALLRLGAAMEAALA